MCNNCYTLAYAVNFDASTALTAQPRFEIDHAYQRCSTWLWWECGSSSGALEMYIEPIRQQHRLISCICTIDACFRHIDSTYSPTTIRNWSRLSALLYMTMVRVWKQFGCSGNVYRADSTATSAHFMYIYIEGCFRHIDSTYSPTTIRNWSIIGFSEYCTIKLW